MAINVCTHVSTFNLSIRLLYALNTYDMKNPITYCALIINVFLLSKVYSMSHMVSIIKYRST